MRPRHTMGWVTVVILPVILIVSFGIVTDSVRHQCTQTVKFRTRTQTYEGWWKGWRGDSKYKTSYKRVTVCCHGYGPGSGVCNPKCGNGYYDGCNVKEGGFIYDNDTRITHSGGKCESPNHCTGCNQGYYANNSLALCKACTHIPDCNKPACTNSTDAVCHKCSGEIVAAKYGYNVYTGNPTRRKCQRACSWQNGYRCFPGTCGGNMVYSDCTCTEGFTGGNCHIATKDKLPNILSQTLELIDNDEPKLIVPNPQNPLKETWTNIITWSHISFDTSADYKVGSITTPSYIISNESTAPKIGIDTIQVDLTLSRRSPTNERLVYKWTSSENCTFEDYCKFTSANVSVHMIPWKPDINMEGGFQHDDSITFTIYAKNGGSVPFIDREDSNRKRSYKIIGIANSITTYLGFDLHTPIHCVESNYPCTNDALHVADFSKTKTVDVKWNGWDDLNSQIKEYQLKVFSLIQLSNSTDAPLKLGLNIIYSSEVLDNQSSTQISVEAPGLYSLEFTVFDWAGNYKSARRVFHFDDISQVDLHGKPTYVATANKTTGYKWINKHNPYIEIVWTSRFINKRHSTNGWLNGVERDTNVPQDLEDVKGVSDRTIEKIPNIQGIARFEVAYKIDYPDYAPDSFHNFTAITGDYFSQQKMVFHEELEDGKQMTFYVRGYDVMDEFAQDDVVVTIDLSPPVIRNVWLTNGDIHNISVHSVLELNQLTIEWEAYDRHSGLHEISWRLFDNFTNKDIVHGKAYEIPQGASNSIEQCETKYAGYARGAKCYCTPFDGCFHQHFQVKPAVTITGEDGIHDGRQHGVHEHDYYIEITATNIALLISITYLKITIDTSPPTAGIVHDGISGDEIDFQQSLHLFSNWDGFFDKESGVWFYLYAYDRICLQAEQLDIHSYESKVKVIKTYGKSSETIVTEPGRYHLTVVAYNHALDRSEAVCSDGVTIDSEAAEVSEIVIKNAITQARLIKNTQNRVWELRRNRVLIEIDNPSLICIEKAYLVDDNVITLTPHKRLMNGTMTKTMAKCTTTGAEQELIIYFLDTHSFVDISWNVSHTRSGIFSFDIGLASDASTIPDIMPFKSTKHQHMRIFHPDIWNGQLLYIILKSTTKASVVSEKVIGPFLVSTTKPEFEGSIGVLFETTSVSQFLVAKWDTNAFVDHGNQKSLKYQIAVGSKRLQTDIQPFKMLSAGGSCNITIPPTCTSFNINTLPWHLHDHKTYYVTVKATDITGQFATASSNEYIHDISFASEGLVHDININSPIKFIDIDDIDFQTDTTQLSVRWTGFRHPHLKITFYICVTNTTYGDYMRCDLVDTSASIYTFTDLKLVPYQTYYQVVIGETKMGNVSSLSDGVTIVVDGDVLHGIQLHDGKPCNDSIDDDFNVETSHHSEDKRSKCLQNIDYQFSTNELQAYWTVPLNIRHYIQDIYWAVEERAPVVEHFTIFKHYEHLKMSLHVKKSDLVLKAGRTYRITLKFCANDVCFHPLFTNGVSVIPNPPVGDGIKIQLEAGSKLSVEFAKFYDPDIEDSSEARLVMDHYEWAFTDNSHDVRLTTKWTRVPAEQNNTNNMQEMIRFDINLDRNGSLSKCLRLAVRGYTKAGLSLVVSSDIRNCSDARQVRPNIAIDAVGARSISSDKHEGLPIAVEENDIWPYDDKDYSPYHNILSAVWPTLRHKDYKWALLLVNEEDSSIFYKKTEDLHLPDPCSHPDMIKCGTTDLSYVNALFEDGELVHGRRYVTCVYAETKTIKHELWTQELAEVSACSDGVTVDLTPPIPGTVWIGNTIKQQYQTSSSAIIVNWNSFRDVEEEKYSVHSSGITGYYIAIGTSKGGEDILIFKPVGLRNHCTVHELRLQSGHTYFATVKAFDFTGQSSVSWSPGIKVDTTPPIRTGRNIQLPSRHITNRTHVSACWVGVFRDDESGVSHYSWAIGTHPGYEDMMAYIDTIDDCSQTDINDKLSLVDGHSYFISVKAYNNAGLYTIAVSWAITVETTPPLAGHVYDGLRKLEGRYHDVDFVQNTSTLHVHWEDFHDSHSTVINYHINSGSCPTCDDVLVRQPIGVRNDISLTMLQLVEGQRYYTTVTACNTADLCTSATSDGVVVDLSPPIKGRVLDGTDATDIQFQATRNYLACKWYGFLDPQSGISNYVWRVGTSKGADDIMAGRDMHTTKEAFIFDVANELNLQLPTETKIYSTIRAYNKAGMFVEVSSNGFIIDDTPPIVNQPLKQSPVGMIVPNTSVLRSVFRVEWNVEDPESFIDLQYLSISSHEGGDFNLSSIRVEGVVRDYTFTGLTLHDGSYYDIHLTACNGAKMCVETSLNQILVDSSPPKQGMFAINTDHAAELGREPDGWMTWTPVTLNLAWLGFTDIHSGIQSYTLNIGNTYMANDLNEEAHVPNKVFHHVDGPSHAEGLVQIHKIKTQELTKIKSIFISMWATNGVGIKSPIVHAEFALVNGGMLELVRRCSPSTCHGHCTCAPDGQLCSQNYTACSDISANYNASIEIKDYVDLAFPSESPSVAYSPVNSFLAAKWEIIHHQDRHPLWFEWSVGESRFDKPMGIFDEISERVWHDSGKNTNEICMLPKDKILTERDKYSFFVRAWYDKNTYAVFKSPGVIIYPSPPTVTSIRGKMVKDLLAGTEKDIDFVKGNSKIEADWTGKFLNTDTIAKYNIYLSSHPGGHDAHVVQRELIPSVTSFNISGLHLEEDTRYYTVVQAYNLAGLHTTVSSDGFTLDNHPPTSGIVHDGKAFRDVHAINSSTNIPSFWHGFSDLGSGIKTYEICVSTQQRRGFCDILDTTPTSIRTKYEYIAPVPLLSGSFFVSEVRAVDVVGHVSETVVSNGIVVDTTPPVRADSLEYDQNILMNPSFERNNTFRTLNDESLLTVCDTDFPEHWLSNDKTCLAIIKLLPPNKASDGSHCLLLSGHVSQAVQILQTGRYRVQFLTSTIYFPTVSKSSFEIFMDINGERHVLLTYEKPAINKDGVNLIGWQKHVMFYNIIDTNVTITVGTVDYKSVVLLDNIEVQHSPTPTKTTANKTGHIKSHTTFIHNWASIHTDWNFVDTESDIVEYLWAIGTVQGGTQLQEFTSVGRRTFAYRSDLYLTHNTDVYITVVAINSAGLRTVSYSDQILIDLTPPVFTYINDGLDYGTDLDFQQGYTLSSHWEVTDSESGITDCTWAIGTLLGEEAIQRHTVIPFGQLNASSFFTSSAIPSSVVYVYVRCTNGAGLTHTSHSDGITVLTSSPSTEDVLLEVLATSATQFLVHGIYHGNASEIRFRWTGFRNDEGIDRYLIALNGDNVHMSELVIGTTSGFTFAGFTNLNLKDGQYSISVTAINQIEKYSQKISSEVYVLTKKPTFTGSPMTVIWDASVAKATASWEDVFQSDHSMYYEVTVRLSEGGDGDLVQWQETTNTRIQIAIALGDLPATGVTVQFSVRAISYCGLYITAHENLFVQP